uniref:Protein kinase domain-containing protein n=1 Tax=Heterorhabditis bacteriophora TaxID=37862 RepID=A0A1I7X9T0_HETBA
MEVTSMIGHENLLNLLFGPTTNKDTGIMMDVVLYADDQPEKPSRPCPKRRSEINKKLKWTKQRRRIGEKRKWEI